MNDSHTLPEAEPQFLSSGDGTKIAYHRLPGRLPGIIFLGGFMSDMGGTKALGLETFCRQTGQAFIRFDYFGHGASSGTFAAGTISRWKNDAIAVLDELTEGPQILVGSSMGAWIMLLAAVARRDRVAALIGLAPAPDFTESLIWETLDKRQRKTLEDKGSIELPKKYDDRPFIVTKALIEDGRDNLVMRGPIDLTCPVRLIHGMRDQDVPPEISLRLCANFASEDLTLTYIKHADHRLSDISSLSRIFLTVAEIINMPAAKANPPSA